MSSDKPEKDVLLEEYRQLMTSQRDNTQIAYSWVGNILMVLGSGLFVFGLTTENLSRFIPALILGMLLSFVWIGVTEAFARYTRQRFDRINKICQELGIPPVEQPAGTWVDTQLLKVPKVGKWLNRSLSMTQVRTYVVLFVAFYNVAWLVRLSLGLRQGF